MIQLLQFFLTAWVIIGVLFLLGLIAGVAAVFVYAILALYHIARKHIRDIIEEHRPPKPCETEECRTFRKAFYGPVLQAFDTRPGYLTTKRPISWTVSWKGSDRYKDLCKGTSVHCGAEVGTYDPNDGGVKT